MMSHVNSASIWGTDALHVTVEADVQLGLPTFSIVGLPDNSVKESKERVRSAIINSGHDFPPKRITLNLAPADVKKEGGLFDLPISIAILTALGVLPPEKTAGYLFVGELGLDGSVRGVRGTVSAAFLTKKLGLKGIVCPSENIREALLSDGHVWPVKSLPEAVSVIMNDAPGIRNPVIPEGSFLPEELADLAEIKGQSMPKRVLEIAAAGRHNMLMIGPPGAGKSMLAKALPSILPSLTRKEILECTRIYSAAGRLSNGRIITTRPFRAPHHTISDAGLIGGGSTPMPGEVTLSHNGVLFLDELPEFRRSALESLRQPIEDGNVTVARASTSVVFPASFQLLTAMNPCPCGYHGHPSKECRCTPVQLARYRTRISGPLLDRIDLHVWVDPVKAETIFRSDTAPGSNEAKKRIMDAVSIQAGRGFMNSRIPDRLFKELCIMDSSSRSILTRAIDRYSLSMRGYRRVIKVARTIADLDNSEIIRQLHMTEALQYRPEMD